MTENYLSRWTEKEQATLRELRDALDALPKRQLIAGEEVNARGQVCALGAIAKRRGPEVLAQLKEARTEDYGKVLGTTADVASTIFHENDANDNTEEQPGKRWRRMRDWVDEQLKKAAKHKLKKAAKHKPHACTPDPLVQSAQTVYNSIH